MREYCHSDYLYRTFPIHRTPQLGDGAGVGKGASLCQPCAARAKHTHTHARARLHTDTHAHSRTQPCTLKHPRARCRPSDRRSRLGALAAWPAVSSGADVGAVPDRCGCSPGQMFVQSWTDVGSALRRCGQGASERRLHGMAGANAVCTCGSEGRGQMWPGPWLGAPRSRAAQA